MFVPVNKSEASKFSYYPALDGLRGVAIILVIAFHDYGYVKLFEGGWIGVDLFFVLSGFLITSILLRTEKSRLSLRNFYMRRALRILPLYYGSLILYLYVLPNIIRFPFSVSYFINNQQWFWFYVQNWLFIFKNTGSNTYLDHFWSLALEEQFYLIWPVILLVMVKTKKIVSPLIWVLGILLLLRVVLWAFHFESFNYITFYKFTRIDGLCIGSLLAALQWEPGPTVIRKQIGSPLVIILATGLILSVAGFFFSQRLAILVTCIYPAVSIFWGLVVYAILLRRGVLSVLLSNPVLRFVGKISYGLYIFHWPVYKLLYLQSHSWFNFSFSTVLPEQLLISTISLALALILAVISYYCVEIHFLKLKRFFA